MHVSFHEGPSVVVDVTRDAASVVSIPANLVVAPSVLSRNAISIQTNNSMQSVSVYGLNTNQNSSNVFLALPIRELGGIERYEYAHFSRPPTQNAYSMFVLSNCDDDVVVPFLQSPARLSGLVPVRDVYRQFVDSREFIEDRPTPLRMKEKFESLHFENASLDISSIKAWADRPFSFTSGLTCASEGCSHFSQQVPPSYTWGYSFTSFPVVLDSVLGYQIKVVAAYYNETLLTYYCNDSSNGSAILTDEVHTLAFPAGTVCSLSSDRPIGVVQILIKDGDSGGSMVWLPPAGQYLNRISFPADMFTIESRTMVQEAIWVTVSAEHFDTNLIQLDGLMLQQDREQWEEIRCSLVEVCAYGITVQLPKGKHTLQHHGCPGCLSVTIYGEVEGSTYAYSAGFAMDPIGGNCMCPAGSH